MYVGALLGCVRLPLLAPGGGGMQVLFLHSRQLEVLFSCGWRGAGGDGFFLECWVVDSVWGG